MAALTGGTDAGLPGATVYTIVTSLIDLPGGEHLLQWRLGPAALSSPRWCPWRGTEPV